MKKFIEIEVGNHQILHGFDSDNKEIIEKVEQDYIKKLVSIERILSIGEKYILTSYAFNRIIYWEYKGDLEDIRKLID